MSDQYRETTAPCPHQGCPRTLRFTLHRPSGVVRVYHGEDCFYRAKLVGSDSQLAAVSSPLAILALDLDDFIDDLLIEHGAMPPPRPGGLR